MWPTVKANIDKIGNLRVTESERMGLIMENFVKFTAI
jgi:hypothetical protein